MDEQSAEPVHAQADESVDAQAVSFDNEQAAESTDEQAIEPYDVDAAEPVDAQATEPLAAEPVDAQATEPHAAEPVDAQATDSANTDTTNSNNEPAVDPNAKNKILVCPLSEHTHTDACRAVEPQRYCGFEAHVETCYDASGNLLCTNTNHHEHTTACEVNPSPITEKPLTKLTSLNSLEADKGMVIVRHGANAADVELLTKQGTTAAKTTEFYKDKQLVTVVNGMESPTPKENLWTYHTAKTRESITLANADDPSVQVTITPNPNTATGGWAVERVQENAAETVAAFAVDEPSYSFDIYATGEDVVLASENPQCNDPNCKLGHYLDDKGGGVGRFETPSIISPFGGAQGFNLFVVPGSDTAHGNGSIHNWGEVHANAAIAGNVCGTNQHIVYNENSVGNYSGELVDHFDIGLILGGMRTEKNDPDCNTPASSQDDKVVVRNGSVLVQQQYEQGINMETGIDKDHVQYVEEADLKAYFDEAAAELRTRNEETSSYSETLPNNAAHTGTVRYLQESDTQKETTMAGDNYEMYQEAAALVLQAGHDLDGDGTVDTHGDDFYNIFNVKLSQLAPRTSSEGGVVARQIYLDVPYGSYALINIIDDRADKTVTPNIAPVIRYKNSNGKWIDQPADKSANDDYMQTQRTLMNFAPSIEEVNMNCMGNYLYTSILAPNMQIYVPSTSQVQIQGTVVVDGLYCENASNNSAILENPFMAGAQITLNKAVACDSHTPQEAEDCFICNNNNAADNPLMSNPWDGYYADLTLTSVDEQTGSIREMFVEKLALNGEPWVINGLTPGAYKIAEEFVYKLDSDNSTKIPVETIDEDANDATWNEHSFSHALFGEDAVLIVKSGDTKPITVVNHYALGETTSYSVRKEWQSLGTNEVIEPPAGAKVELTLYRKVGETGSGEKVEMEGLKNPVTLSQNNAWFYQWNGLPKNNDQGADYIYYVMETLGYPGFEPGKHWDEDDKGSNTHIHVYVNQEKEKIPGSLTVAKQWLDPSGYIIDPAVALEKGLSAEMKLYRKTGTMPEVGAADPARNCKVTVKLGESFVEYAVPRGTDLKMKLYYYATSVGENLQLLAGNAELVFSANWDWKPGVSATTKQIPGNVTDQFSGSSVTVTVRNVTANTTIELGAASGKTVATVPVAEWNSTDAQYPAISRDELEKPEETFPDSMMHWTEWTAYTPEGQPHVVTLPSSDPNNPWQNSDKPWEYTWTKLPANNATETSGATEWYRYFVFETPMDKYDTTYLVGNKTYAQQAPEDAKTSIPGIVEGQITVQNQDNPAGPELPMTGGAGTALYTAGGAVLLGAAAILIMKKRRMEG